MKMTLTRRAEGTRDLEFRGGPGPAVTVRNLTGHDVRDLAAIIGQDQAGSEHCDDEDTGHTCVMPPGHWILPHVCRACRHQWVTPALRARGDARTAVPGGLDPAARRAEQRRSP
jgi:hypothetical protein